MAPRATVKTPKNMTKSRQKDVHVAESLRTQGHSSSTRPYTGVRFLKTLRLIWFSTCYLSHRPLISMHRTRPENHTGVMLPLEEATRL